MLIELQCVIYQWIRLDKLYIPIRSSFFQISESYFEQATIVQIIVALGLCNLIWTS